MLLVATFLAFQQAKAHYLPYGPGLRFPAVRLSYPLVNRALAPVWSQSPYSEAFLSKLDGLGGLQVQVYAYLKPRPPKRVQWKLDEVAPGHTDSLRTGWFLASDARDYGFIRLRFPPIANSAAKLYKLTLSAPETRFPECMAIILFSTNSPDARDAAFGAQLPNPLFATVPDENHQDFSSAVLLPGGATLSERFTPTIEWMSAIQLQFVKARESAPDYKLRWKIERETDGAAVGSGTLDPAAIDDFQFTDLFLTRPEHSRGQTYRLTLAAESQDHSHASIGLPVYPDQAENVTLADSGGSRVLPGVSAFFVMVHSTAYPSFRLFDSTHPASIPANEIFSSNSTLWYFPPHHQTPAAP